MKKQRQKLPYLDFLFSTCVFYDFIIIIHIIYNAINNFTYLTIVRVIRRRVTSIQRMTKEIILLLVNLFCVFFFRFNNFLISTFFCDGNSHLKRKDISISIKYIIIKRNTNKE